MREKPKVLIAWKLHRSSLVRPHVSLVRNEKLLTNTSCLPLRRIILLNGLVCLWSLIIPYPSHNGEKLLVLQGLMGLERSLLRALHVGLALFLKERWKRRGPMHGYKARKLKNELVIRVRNPYPTKIRLHVKTPARLEALTVLTLKKLVNAWKKFHSALDPMRNNTFQLACRSQDGSNGRFP